MLTTPNDVLDTTGYSVDNALIYQAQSIIMAYTGRVEVEVEDPRDRMLLGQATIYQAVYMKDNYDRVFQQVAVKAISQTDGGMTLDTDKDAPFMSPLAVMTCRRLSWMKSRSVRTGPIFNRPRWLDEWRTN